MALSPENRTKNERQVKASTVGALLFLAALALFRLWYGSVTGLAEDEAHYWQWSRYPAAAYYDQGPGIAFCILWGRTIFGNTELGVRVVPILLAFGTGWLLFETVRRWFGDVAALWSIVLINGAPLLAAGGILATYDNPLIFCWAAALLALTVTLQSNRAEGWYLVGIFVGLGGLCKITALLFAPCVLLFLLISPNYRRWLFAPQPYLAFGMAIILFFPVVFWNAENDWVAFRHWQALGNRSRGAPPLKWLGDFWGGQAVALGPFLIFGELAALVWWTRYLLRPTVPKNADAVRFMLAFALPILLICTITALRSKLEANWPAPAHLTGIMAVAVWFGLLWQTGRIVPRIGIFLSLLTSLLLSGIAVFPQLLTIADVPISANLAQKLNQTYGWHKIAERVQKIRLSLEAEGKPVFVGGVNYRTNSVLAFYLPDQPRTHGLFLGGRRDQYYLWQNPKSLLHQNAILCLDEKNDAAIERASQLFDSVTLADTITVKRSGFAGAVKEWRVYTCRNFHGYDPAKYLDGY